MMHGYSINWQAVEAIGVWAGALAAIVALIAAWRSLKSVASQTRSASDQARAAGIQANAASRQVEALSRPFVVVASALVMPSDTLKWMNDVIPTEIENDDPHAALMNVGSGPALNLTWNYERTPRNRVIRGFCPCLGVVSRFRFGFPVEVGVGPKRIICEYSSANGAQYRSTITLDGRSIIGCEVHEK